MLAHLIANTGEPLPVLELAEVPRAGDTLALDTLDATLWRVRRVHWRLATTAGAACQGVDLHLARAALPPEDLPHARSDRAALVAAGPVRA